MNHIGERGKVVYLIYKNWRSEVRARRILPHSETLRYGTNEWHTEDQWLFQATDLTDGVKKEFAMSGVLHWTTATDQSLPWRTE